MEVHAFSSVNGGTVDLDLCFQCHDIWFEPQENLKLTPAAVVDMFRLLRAHRTSVRQPLPNKLACPHCRAAFSSRDPKAVERALQGDARAASSAEGVKIPQLSDALVMLERDRQTALREQKAQDGSILTRDVPDVDLWSRV
jgi:Zn-finger nucleic acid-binding protein